MNLNRRRKNGADSDDGMSSMTDLVFLMLIFFIIMSTMAKHALPVDLPTGKALPTTQKDALVEVGVNAQSEYFLDDNMTTIYTLEEIVPILTSKIAEQTIPSLKISGDKKASYESIFNLISTAKQKDWKPVLTYKK
jgi:biopolymer transport protein ExbD